MPISVSNYIRATPDDDSFGRDTPPEQLELTPEQYRFSGYKLIYDSEGNIIRILKPKGDQPQIWWQRAVREGGCEFRNP
jgi:hypothetical protein